MPSIERRDLLAASAAAIGAAVPAQAAEAIVLTEYWATKQRNGAEIRLAVYRKRIGNAARPVLFLVHGSSTSARSSFDLSVPGHDDYSMMDAFARYGFDVWTMDHEGYGKSSRTDSNSDIASGVEDLKAATAVIARETGQTRCRNSSPICRTCADSGPSHPSRCSSAELSHSISTGGTCTAREKRDGRRQGEIWAHSSQSRRPHRRDHRGGDAADGGGCRVVRLGIGVGWRLDFRQTPA